MFVHGQLATAIGCQTGCFDFQLVAVRGAPDRIQQRFSANFLTTLQQGEHFVALFIEADRNYFFPKTKYRPQLPQLEAQALDDLPIHKIQQRGALIEHASPSPPEP